MLSFNICVIDNDYLGDVGWDCDIIFDIECVWGGIGGTRVWCPVDSLNFWIWMNYQSHIVPPPFRDDGDLERDGWIFLEVEAKEADGWSHGDRDVSCNDDIRSRLRIFLLIRMGLTNIPLPFDDYLS